VAVAVGYRFALQYRHESFEMVIHTLGIFASLLFAVAAFFTWWDARTSHRGAGA
jgi:hypothetical protein